MESRDFAILGLGALAGALIGGATTYLLSKKRIEQFYTEVAVDQIQSAKQSWEDAQARKEEEVEVEITEQTQTINLDDYIDIISHYGGYGGDPADLSLMFSRNIPLAAALQEMSDIRAQNVAKAEEEPVEIDGEVHNVFDDNAELELDDPELESYQEYVASRKKNEPYVIHINEFMSPNDAFGKVSLRYYSLDDTLVDDNERPIPDINRLIGDALDHLGKFSNDKNIVYVRNERPDVMLEFEVQNIDDSFEHAILGVPNDHKIHKMREDD